MSQEEVAGILANKWPRFVPDEEIITECMISRRSVRRCLAAMEKRDEVEYKIIRGNHLNSGWKKLYRIKEEQT